MLKIRVKIKLYWIFSKSNFYINKYFMDDNCPFKEEPGNINLTNMVTMLRDRLIKTLHSKIFAKDGDMEIYTKRHNF